jgi:hypothetical protein
MQEGISIPQEMIYRRRNFLLGELAELRKASFPFHVFLTVRMENSGSAGRIFIEVDI